MPAAQYAQRQDAVERVLEMQSQAAVAAAAGLTVERDTWCRLDVLVAIANELEPEALDKKLGEVATTDTAAYEGASRSDCSSVGTGNAYGSGSQRGVGGPRQGGDSWCCLSANAAGWFGVLTRCSCGGRGAEASAGGFAGRLRPPA